MPTQFEVGGLYYMFVQHRGTCNSCGDYPHSLRRLTTPIRVVRISKHRKRIWYESDGAIVQQSLWRDRVEHQFYVEDGRRLNPSTEFMPDDIEFICNRHGDGKVNSFCDAHALVLVRQRPYEVEHLSFSQKIGKVRNRRNWLKFWIVLKLLVLAQRAKERAYRPGHSGARAAQANFERAAKRQCRRVGTGGD